MVRKILLKIALLICTVSLPVFAQTNFPDKPIKTISAYAAGGGPDVQLRQVSPYLGEALKQTIIVENKVGAGGVLATQFVAQSSPDGYTLLLGSNIQLVQTEFPGVDKWIREAHRVIGKRRFAHLLQRAESYLLLNDVCKRFNELFPVVPLFTIHDAILTHPKYLPVLTGFLVDRLAKITGVDVGVKTKLPQIVPEPQIEDIDHEWDNIKAVTTTEKFNSVCGSVFSSNVMRGSDFLKKTGQIF